MIRPDCLDHGIIFFTYKCFLVLSHCLFFLQNSTLPGLSSFFSFSSTKINAKKPWLCWAKLTKMKQGFLALINFFANHFSLWIKLDWKIEKKRLWPRKISHKNLFTKIIHYDFFTQSNLPGSSKTSSGRWENPTLGSISYK